MPEKFTKADVQKLLDAKTPEDVESELVAHGYEVDDEGPGDEAEKPGDDMPPDAVDGGVETSGIDKPKKEPPPFFKKRSDVAKDAMKKVGFPDDQEDY